MGMEVFLNGGIKMNKINVAILTDYLGESMNSTPNVRAKTLCDNFDTDIYLRHKFEDLSGLNAKSINNYNIFRLFKNCIKNKYDIIYVSGIHHYFIAWICSKLSKGKLILDIYDDITLGKTLIKSQKGFLSKIKYYIYLILFWLGKPIIKSADKVFLTLNENILKYYPKRKKGYVKLRNGIWSSIIQENNKNQLNKLECRKFNITYVGYVREDRGIFKMLEAMKIIKENNKNDFIFNIVGPVDKNDETEINNYIKNNNLEKNIILYGLSKYDTVKEVLNFSDLAIYFFPTGRRELDYIYPIKILEYVAFGLAIIATNGYGIEELKKDFPSQINTCEYNSTHLANLILEKMLHKTKKQISNNINKYYWENINETFISEINKMF